MTISDYFGYLADSVRERFSSEDSNSSIWPAGSSLLDKKKGIEMLLRNKSTKWASVAAPEYFGVCSVLFDSIKIYRINGSSFLRPEGCYWAWSLEKGAYYRIFYSKEEGIIWEKEGSRLPLAFSLELKNSSRYERFEYVEGEIYVEEDVYQKLGISADCAANIKEVLKDLRLPSCRTLLYTHVKTGMEIHHINGHLFARKEAASEAYRLEEVIFDGKLLYEISPVVKKGEEKFFSIEQNGDDEFLRFEGSTKLSGRRSDLFGRYITMIPKVSKSWQQVPSSSIDVAAYRKKNIFCYRVNGYFFIHDPCRALAICLDNRCIYQVFPSDETSVIWEKEKGEALPPLVFSIMQPNTGRWHQRFERMVKKGKWYDDVCLLLNISLTELAELNIALKAIKPIETHYRAIVVHTQKNLTIYSLAGSLFARSGERKFLYRLDGQKTFRLLPAFSSGEESLYPIHDNGQDKIVYIHKTAYWISEIPQQRVFWPEPPLLEKSKVEPQLEQQPLLTFFWEDDHYFEPASSFLAWMIRKAFAIIQVGESPGSLSCCQAKVHHRGSDVWIVTSYPFHLVINERVSIIIWPIENVGMMAYDPLNRQRYFLFCLDRPVVPLIDFRGEEELFFRKGEYVYALRKLEDQAPYADIDLSLGAHLEEERPSYQWSDRLAVNRRPRAEEWLNKQLAAVEKGGYSSASLPDFRVFHGKGGHVFWYYVPRKEALMPLPIILSSRGRVFVESDLRLFDLFSGSEVLSSDEGWSTALEEVKSKIFEIRLSLLKTTAHPSFHEESGYYKFSYDEIHFDWKNIELNNKQNYEKIIKKMIQEIQTSGYQAPLLRRFLKVGIDDSQYLIVLNYQNELSQPLCIGFGTAFVLFDDFAYDPIFGKKVEYLKNPLYTFEKHVNFLRNEINTLKIRQLSSAVPSRMPSYKAVSPLACNVPYLYRIAKDLVTQKRELFDLYLTSPEGASYDIPANVFVEDFSGTVKLRDGSFYFRDGSSLFTVESEALPWSVIKTEVSKNGNRSFYWPAGYFGLKRAEWRKIEAQIIDLLEQKDKGPNVSGHQNDPIYLRKQLLDKESRYDYNANQGACFFHFDQGKKKYTFDPIRGIISGERGGRGEISPMQPELKGIPPRFFHWPYRFSVFDDIGESERLKMTKAFRDLSCMLNGDRLPKECVKNIGVKDGDPVFLVAGHSGNMIFHPASKTLCFIFQSGGKRYAYDATKGLLFHLVKHPYVLDEDGFYAEIDRSIWKFESKTVPFLSKIGNLLWPEIPELFEPEHIGQRKEIEKLSEKYLSGLRSDLSFHPERGATCLYKSEQQQFLFVEEGQRLLVVFDHSGNTYGYDPIAGHLYRFYEIEHRENKGELTVEIDNRRCYCRRVGGFAEEFLKEAAEFTKRIAWTNRTKGVYRSRKKEVYFDTKELQKAIAIRKNDAVIKLSRVETWYYLYREKMQTFCFIKNFGKEDQVAYDPLKGEEYTDLPGMDPLFQVTIEGKQVKFHLKALSSHRGGPKKKLAIKEIGLEDERFHTI